MFKSVVQILAEGAMLHHCGQVAIGGGEDARFDRNAVCGADRPDLALLKSPQQLGLQVERELAYLVEKDRSASGRDKEAILGVVGAGKGALDIAEEFALNECRNQRAAIHGQKRFFRVGSEGMDATGDEFLTRAALAQDQDRMSGLRHL